MGVSQFGSPDCVRSDHGTLHPRRNSPATPPDIDSPPPNNGREAVDVPVNKFKPCPVLIGLLGNVDLNCYLFSWPGRDLRAKEAYVCVNIGPTGFTR